MLKINFLFAVVAITSVAAHPQCLDFGPPFDLATPLTFCTEYATYGCCSSAMDDVIRAEYDTMLSAMETSETLSEECAEIAKALLCQRCSPYAAHIYDVESNPQAAATTPGLCADYCLNMYENCSALVNATAQTAAEVCASFSIEDEIYCYPDLKSNSALNGDIDRETITADGCLCLEPFADQLRNPLAFKAPPDDTGRVFIVEQLGVVHVFYKNGTKRDAPFMDISDDVLVTSNRGDERGFLGLAFHPDFQQNGRFYTFISITNSKRRHASRISEFQVSSDDFNVANYTSERVILEIEQPFNNHNGGEVR